MDDAKTIWSLWQSMLESFQPSFTRGGWVRFAQWVTSMALCDEEHTITQSLTSCAAEDRWRVIEHFAEYGSWDRPAVERQLERLVAAEAPQMWAGYRVMALDDTKEHRTSPDVWGTCTFHESTARSPNRAETVRAHNWVVLGSLTPGQPWDYAPLASRLYFRKEQLPVGETFRTKTELAVELFQQADDQSPQRVLAVFDGAYANQSVIGPLLAPTSGGRRIQFVARRPTAQVGPSLAGAQRARRVEDALDQWPGVPLRPAAQVSLLAVGMPLECDRPRRAGRGVRVLGRRL
jgi:hypothetical protein